MPKKPSRPDINQLAALIVAKAAGVLPPEAVKKYDHLVKKPARKKPAVKKAVKKKK